MKLALEDVKVIEYGESLSAPFCSKLLADLGAEVIKVEKPIEGDMARRKGPYPEDKPGIERSGLFLYLNTNKLGVTLDLDKETGREIFRKLIKDTGILVEDTKPAKLAELGLNYHNLKSVNPSLIMTSITPFGQTGPYKDYKSSDLINWHMGGLGYITPRFAEEEHEPLVAPEMADLQAGITAAVATMCALRVQRSSGVGQQVDVSQLESTVLSAGPYIPYYTYEHRSPTRLARSEYAPYHSVRCKDGWMFLQCHFQNHWERFVEIMGNPEWAGEEIFGNLWSRGKYYDSLLALISEWTKDRTREEIFEAAKVKKTPVAPVNLIGEVVESGQMREREFFVDIDHPEVGKLTYPGAPYKLSQTPWTIRRPAPLLGQHNEDIYCKRLGFSKGALTKLYETGII